MRYLERRARLIPAGLTPLNVLLQGRCYAVDETISRGFTDGCKRTDYCAILFTVAGSSHYRINRQRVVLTPGSLLILPPGISFSEKAPELCHNRYLMLQGPLVPEITAVIPAGASFSFWPECPSEVAASLGRCVALAHERPEPPAWRLGAELCLLVDGLIARGPGRPGESVLRERVRKLVLETGGEPAAVGRIARKLGMSESAFAHQFREQTGETPAAFVRRLRCEIARSHLETGLTVLETSVRLGFKTPFHFSKVFRVETGVPPSHFIPRRRRLHRAAGR